MAKIVQKPNTRAFQLLDKAFWVIWALLPLLFYKLWQLINDPSQFADGLTPGQVGCLSGVFDPSKFSTSGKFVYNLPLMVSFIFYVILISSFHRMIHRFAAGGAFDAFTLRAMRTLSVALLVFPFIDFVVGHFASATLQYWGEMNISNAPSFIDIGVIAAGLFMFSLMIVLKNAIDIKSENDLTI